ncbi:MAG TPA: zf-HC2 domain-containing protein [Terracidiphilus sp.]|nr:zf-HC2 domain-containing protein [Terracidiphilus sp.]
MSDHLSETALTALVDGELSPGDLAAAKLHIDSCLSCASLAVNEWLLKSAVAKPENRYAMPPDFQVRIAKLISAGRSDSSARESVLSVGSPTRHVRWIPLAAWAAAFVIFALALGGIVFDRMHRSAAVQAERAAVATEVTDLHIASLAANEPQVISSDRHTVKPWFQGKLPFSFNIPETLPDGVTLLGANFAYLRGQPAAQLIFTLGAHRASVFIAQSNGIPPQPPFEASDAGFHVVAFEAAPLEVIAVSDADPSRLESLAASVKSAQAQP